MCPQLTAGSAVDQPKGQARLPPRSPGRPEQIVSGRWRPADGYPAAPQRHTKVLRDAGRYLEIFRSCLDLAKGERRPTARGHKGRAHRSERADKEGLPFQRLGRGLAVPAAIFDGESAAVGKAGT